MSSSKKSASRYSSFDSQSSTSSSLDLKPTSKIKSFRKNSTPNSNFSSGVSKTQPKDAIVKVRNEQNFAAMVKKFMNKRSNSTSKKAVNGDLPVPLIVPADFIADDLKKTARKGSTFAALPKKLFGKGKGSSSGSGSSSSENKSKALTEVKANTRTLAMVLRSERELLALNKEQETQIAQLKSLLHGRNIEVEKLKDLCLKQREEIKALKSAILFPEEMNSQLQVLLEKQGSELKQAKQVIPSLQRQISSLTGQLQTLSEDLAEVKAVKYSSPRTPMYSQEEAANSLDFSSDDDDPTTPDSPNDMLLKDLNPCLTPFYSKMKSEDHEATDFDYTHDEGAYEVSPVARKLSRSSDHFSSSRGNTSNACVPFRMSDESKCRYGKRMVL